MARTRVTAKQKSARRRNIKLAQAAKKKGGVGGKKFAAKGKSLIRSKSAMKADRSKAVQVVKMMRKFRGV